MVILDPTSTEQYLKRTDAVQLFTPTLIAERFPKTSKHWISSTEWQICRASAGYHHNGLDIQISQVMFFFKPIIHTPPKVNTGHFPLSVLNMEEGGQQFFSMYLAGVCEEARVSQPSSSSPGSCHAIEKSQLLGIEIEPMGEKLGFNKMTKIKVMVRAWIV